MKSRHSLIALLAVCVLASGCAKKLKPDNLPALSGNVSGTVAYRERIALPPDAKVIVSLEDVTRTGKSGSFIAQQTIRPTTQVPIPFNLRYIPAAIDRSHRYAVTASILDSQDGVIWTSEEATAISFHEPEKPVALLLQRALNPNALATPSANTGMAFKCADIEFIAKFSADKVQILLAGRTLILPHVVSASGARYSDGSNTFWNKGNDALLEINGVSYKGCKTDPLPAK
ncbi:YbaY family lipoprotein [Herminiimonas fonticola]|uniref:Putative lipoprotein n=1 Tax=Herminiimonas fonticola TaxID=303380 RepID=A0A4R6GHR0_9BURK|nr:YbaY family lipoprotein [Herminiimonas fonticola]RBA25368.1 Membrane-bound lysozyme-inhibitor of c-type lysozyme [Herminiimonas fonticola]TDN94482.1 putative lipoprotein [Herminiimonas fonticola]